MNRLGRWDASALIEHIKKAGGITLHSLTGHQPSVGYIVNDSHHTLTLPAATFFSSGEKLLEDFSKVSAYVGIWHDVIRKEVIIDTVEVLQDREEALQLGLQRNQRYIWDAAKAALLSCEKV